MQQQLPAELSHLVNSAQLPQLYETAKTRWPSARGSTNARSGPIRPRPSRRTRGRRMTSNWKIMRAASGLVPCGVAANYSATSMLAVATAAKPWPLSLLLHRRARWSRNKPN